MPGRLQRYWNDLVSYDGGLSIVMMNALLVIPFIMALFFYPYEVLAATGIVVALSAAAYEGFALWRRRYRRARAS